MPLSVDTQWFYQMANLAIEQWNEVLIHMVNDHGIPVPEYNSATACSEKGIIHTEWEIKRPTSKYQFNRVYVDFDISMHDYWGKIWVHGAAVDLDTNWDIEYKSERYPHGILEPAQLAKELADFFKKAQEQAQKTDIEGVRTYAKVGTENV